MLRGQSSVCMRQLATSIRCLITGKAILRHLLPKIMHLLSQCAGTLKSQKSSIQGDLNSGMLWSTDSYEMTQGSSPIITRRSTHELAMNTKLNGALKDDF